MFSRLVRLSSAVLARPTSSATAASRALATVSGQAGHKSSGGALPKGICLAALAGGFMYGMFARADERQQQQIEPPLSPKEFRPFVLKQVQPINHNTRLFRFALSAPTQTINLPVASCLVVRADINGEQVVRPYTPVSDNGAAGHFDLIVKDYPTGKMSRHITELQVGQSLDMKGPFPKLPYTANMKRHIAMIAGGTGITPMLQVLDAILANPEDRTQVTLIFANIAEEDILLRERLDALPKTHPQVSVHYVLEKPPAGWTQAVGRVSPALLKQTLPAPSEDSLVLICGPPPMLEAISGPKGPNQTQGEVAGMLKDLGYTEGQVYKF